MAREHAPTPQHDGVARLVEAERSWQQRLDETRARAAELVAAAEADARRIDAVMDEDIRRAVAARNVELSGSADAAVHDVAAEFASRASMYANAAADLVERIATDIVQHAPWFAAPASDVR